MTLQQLKQLLTKTKNIFHKLSDDEASIVFQQHSLICHPDRNQDNTAEAIIVFKLLNDQYELFLNKNSVKNETVISTKKTNYVVNSTPKYEGDLSAIYETIDETKLVKISNDANYNKFLANEKSSLKEIFKNASQLHYHFLKQIDSFNLDGCLCNVFENKTNNWNKELWSLENLLINQKNHLDERHIAWIFKRILAAVAWCHQNNIIHAAILPQHILVEPTAHNVILVGFTNSTRPHEKGKFIAANFKDLNPPEVLNKKELTYETDVYLAGQVGLYMSNTSVSKQLTSFFKALCLKNQNARPSSVYDLYKQWDELLKQVFGPPKFVELKINY